MNSKSLISFIHYLGDNSMILGHRLSELCGHGPNLETDMALTNISLDLFGQVRNYFQYAATLYDKPMDEDKVAFLRLPHEYKNVLLVEQPNTDFAHVIIRQFLFDQFHLLCLEQLISSKDQTLASIAEKSIKEVKYHHRFSSTWVKRLGDGTSESHDKMQHAIDHFWPYTGEFFTIPNYEEESINAGIAMDARLQKDIYYEQIKTILNEATLTPPEIPIYQSGGKTGIHSEYFGYILAELQYMQRTYPEMSW